MKPLCKISVVCLVCCAMASPVAAMPWQQEGLNRGGSAMFNQTREEIAALPKSADVPPTRVADSLQAPVGAGSGPRYEVYRQALTGRNTYIYPAATPPRNNGYFQSNANSRGYFNGRLANRDLTGRWATPASNRTAVTPSAVPAAYNQNLQAWQAAQANQQQLANANAVRVASAQQAQAQAIQLARLAQAQQQQAQQTLVQAQQSQARAAQLSQTATQPALSYPTYQTAYVQPTLGLAPANAQTCSCVPANPAAYTATETSMRVPATAPYPGRGAPLTLQNMPVGTYFGTGIVGQPTAYRDGQPLRNLFRYITP